MTYRMIARWSRVNMLNECKMKTKNADFLCFEKLHVIYWFIMNYNDEMICIV